MKKIIAVVLVIVGMGCDNSITEFPTTCIRVKVIQNVCGNVVLQILDSKYKPIGENYTFNGVTYSGCFFTVLDCGTTDSPEGQYFNQPDPFFIRINGSGMSPEPGECARCLAMIGNIPSKVYHIKADSCMTDGIN